MEYRSCVGAIALLSSTLMNGILNSNRLIGSDPQSVIRYVPGIYVTFTAQRASLLSSI